MDLNDTNTSNESIPLEPLENPLYIEDKDIEDINNPLYSNAIRPVSIYDKPIINTTMSYIESINNDVSLVNYWDNLSKSTSSGLSPIASEQARKTRQELQDIHRSLVTDFAQKGQVDAVEASVKRLQAVTDDLNNAEVSTYLDTKESAQKASESVIALQEISRKTGKSVEEIRSMAETYSKNLAIRTTLETFVNSLEERSMPVQLLQDIVGLQTAEDLSKLLPAINRKLEDWGFTESVLTNATAQNAVQSLLNNLPEKDAVEFLYDIKASLVDSVGEKDARKFISTLLEDRKTGGDVAVELFFTGLELTGLTTAYSIVKGTIRGGIKMVRPSNAAIASGNADAAAIDVANSIKGAPSVLGHPNPVEAATALNPSVIPNSFHQLSRTVQENLKKSIEDIRKSLASAMPTSGATQDDLARTVKALEERYEPLLNKGVVRADIVPDMNTMRANLSVVYDDKGVLFATREAAEAAYSGKLIGQVEYVEVAQETEKVIKNLKAELNKRIKDLEDEGVDVLSKTPSKPVKPVANMDDVPVSKQSRVENLNEVIQTSKADTKDIAATIARAETIAKVPKVLKTSKPRMREFSIEFSSMLDKALYITSGASFAKRAATGAATAVDKEIIDWVNTVTKGMSAQKRKELRNTILKKVKEAPSTDGVISIPAISKIEIAPATDALKQKWIDLRKKVKEAKLDDVNDGAKLAKALNTPVEKAAQEFQTALSAVEKTAKPRIKAQAITPEIQSKLLAVEETSRMLEEAKAGRYLPKGWVVKQTYDHPVFSDNDLVKLTDNELNATHGPILSAMNPALGAAASFYNVKILDVMKQSKLGKAWSQYFKQMPSLSKGETKKVTQALVKSDAIEKEFDVLELKAQFGIESDAAIEAYYRYRTARNILYAIKDKEAADDLVARGFKEAKVSVLGEDGLTSTIESFVVKTVKDATPLYDKRAFNMVTGKSTSINPESLAQGAQVLEIRGGYLQGRTNYNYIIVAPDKVKVHDITSVVGKKEGTFSRIYTDEFWVTTRFPVSDDVAKEGHRALRTASTLKEAESYVAGMNVLQNMAKGGRTITKEDVVKHLGDFENVPDDVAKAFNAGEYDDVRFEFSEHNAKDAFFRNTVIGGGYDVTTGKLFFSGRGNKAIPSISQKSMEANVADPWESIQREITNTINFVSATEMRRNMIQKWYNTFKDLVPAEMLGKDADTTFANVANRISGLRGFESQRQRQMVAQLKYVLGAIGVETPLEKMQRAAVTTVINSFEKASVKMGGKELSIGDIPVVKHIPALIRQFDAVNFARYLTSHAFLGLFSPRQIWVQSSGMMYTAALHPVHGTKAAFSIKPLLSAYASDQPDVWKWASRTASEKEMGMSSAEFVRVAGAMKRIGLLDNIGASTVHEAADASVNVLKKNKQRFDDASFFLFNSGEAINRVGAFDTARRVWMAANKGKVWDSNEALTEILAMADTFTGNMTRASEAFWQKGILSIPTQFLQYGVKSSANLLAAAKSTATGRKMKGLTTKEMVSAVLATPFIYGFDNTGINGFYDEYLGEKLNGASPEALQYVSQGILSGIINSASIAATGEETRLAIGTMTSPFTFSQDMTNAVFDTGVFELAALGGPFKSLVEGMWGIPLHAITLWEKKEIAPQDVAVTLAQIAADTTQTGRAMWKAYRMAMADGHHFDAQGKLIDIQTTNEIIAKAAGFTLMSEANKNKIYKSDREYEETMKDIAKEVKRLKKKQWQAIEIGDKQTADQMQTWINTLFYPLSITDQRKVMRYIDSPDFRTDHQRFYQDKILPAPTSRGVPFLPNVPERTTPQSERP